MNRNPLVHPRSPHGWRPAALLAAALSSFTFGQEFTVIHALRHGTEGVWPRARLTSGTDGRVYGVTEYGGLHHEGTLFAVNPDGSGFAMLRSFSSADPSDGACPVHALLEASDGRLFGVAPLGGIYGHGTIFRLKRDGSDFTVLRHLNGRVEAAVPASALIEGSDGRLYGLARQGSTAEVTGVVFAIHRDGSGFAVLHRFDAAGGRVPSGLVEGSDRRLYGAAAYGGAHDGGTLFALNRDGSGFAVLHSFHRDVDGHLTLDGVVEASDGKLYGTTQRGGLHGGGTIFSLNRDGSGFTVLRDLGGGSDASFPSGTLVEGDDGRLYGTTSAGGRNGSGAIFTLEPDGSSYALLHSLEAAADGRHPMAALAHGGAQGLYGVALSGGAYDQGTLFTIDRDGSGFAVLRHLSFGTHATGTGPRAGLVEGPDGRLYGTATAGGAFGKGTIFAVNPDGSRFTILRHLSGADGAFPAVPLLATASGRLYGVAWYGEHNYGTLYSLNSDGSGFAILRRLNPRTDGARPWALTEGRDGRLYGATARGGADDTGALFTFNPDGSGFTVLRYFDQATDGANPSAALLSGSDGRLYGTTGNGGGGGGTVFAVDLDGSGFTVLACLTAASVPGRLAEGSDGRLYGASQSGGRFGHGWLFALNRDGSNFAALHHFHLLAGEGGRPAGGVVEGADGRLYGATINGAPLDGGPSSLFSINRDGTGFQVLHVLDDATEGRAPFASLLVASDGRLYGATATGGPNGAGTLYSVALPDQIIKQSAAAPLDTGETRRLAGSSPPPNPSRIGGVTTPLW